MVESNDCEGEMICHNVFKDTTEFMNTNYATARMANLGPRQKTLLSERQYVTLF